MTFKEQALADRSVFVNPDEHGSHHTINGKTFSVTVDNDRLKERTQKEFDGIIVGDILFSARTEDLGFTPKPDQAILYDGMACTIADVKEADGMTEVILNTNRR